MNFANFTFSGKFPFTQDVLAFMQQQYFGLETAITLLGSNLDGVPVIMSGMVHTGTVMTAGYFCLDGTIYYCPGGDTVTFPGGGHAFGITIETTVLPLEFRDGVSHGVYNLYVGVFEVVPTAPAVNRFLVADFLHWGAVFGSENRTEWGSLAVVSATVADVTGTIYYKKDSVANTLHLRWSLNVDDAQSLDPAPTASFYDLQTLPAGFLPTYLQYFTAHRGSSGAMLDFTGDGYLKQFTCKVGTDGVISMELIKPDAGIPSYSVAGNCIVSLD